MSELLDGVTVEWTALGDERFVEIANSARRPVKASLRVSGEVPYYGANNIQDYVDGYTHDGEYVLIAEDGSASLENYSVQYANGKFWANNHVHVVRGKQGLSTKFLYHYLRSVDFSPYLPNKDRSKLTKGEMVKIHVPIPCPGNPNKSLEIQAEIVRRLDTFTELTSELIAELTAELAARKKQYSYYRDQLLSFDGQEVEWKALGDIGEFIRGKRFTKADYVEEGIRVIHYGEIYTRYGAWADQAFSKVRDDMASSLRYAEPGDVVLAGVGETVEDVCKAVAWLGTQSVAIHDDSYAFRHSMNPKYVSYAMQTASFHSQKTKHVSSGKVKRILIEGFKKEVRIPVPYPDDHERSLAEQARIVAILDKFDTLTNSISEDFPREIKLRQKQYEYYRDLLLSFPKPEETVA
ncbi:MULTISPECIES: restriction endonuclease subunit S [unclassified Pseudomonas]|uniref:restriction endonuclease subunit S n=1 Tax=unclassified Pseudomonas TaxID=196821 RepID=UPI000A1EC2B4|nr:MULTISPECIES: restriction endonuclease subunit S [unclassified Pseudomonas]